MVVGRVRRRQLQFRIETTNKALLSADAQRQALVEEWEKRVEESAVELKREREKNEELEKERVVARAQSETVVKQMEELRSEMKKKEEAMLVEAEKKTSIEQEKNTLAFTVTNLMDKVMMIPRVEGIERSADGTHRADADGLRSASEFGDEHDSGDAAEV